MSSSVVKYKRLGRDQALRLCAETRDLDGLKYISSIYGWGYVEYLYNEAYDGRLVNNLKAIEIAKQWSGQSIYSPPNIVSPHKDAYVYIKHNKIL